MVTEIKKKDQASVTAHQAVSPINSCKRSIELEEQGSGVDGE